MPHAGGQYVYLRESFGPLSGFLYGWTLFLVIQTGTIAAVAVAFAKFAGVFVPWISAQNHLIGSGKVGLTTQQLVGIVVVGLLSAVNMRGILVISGMALAGACTWCGWWAWPWSGLCFRPMPGTM